MRQMSALVLACALALTGAAGPTFAASPRPQPHMDCVCTSTHFGDVSFRVRCHRNSTGRWDTAPNGVNKFFEQSTVSCERGAPPLPRRDYQPVRGLGYYKFHPRQTTWEDALRTCAREGANLAVVNSEEEALALARLFKVFPKLHEEAWLNDQAWVGITDLELEGVFLSLTGKSLKQEGYDHWADGEPNNDGNNEHCVAIDRQRLYNDEPCDIKLAFFCERRQ